MEFLSWVPDFLIVLLTTKKPCAEDRMAEITGSPPSDSVRHRTLAPFGGITRIRFKGSSDVRTSQPCGSPALQFQNKTGTAQVNGVNLAPELYVRSGLSLLRCFLLRVRMENRQPIVALFFPHRTGVKSAAGVLPVIRAFNFHCVGRDDHVFLVRERAEVADGK